MKRTLGGRGLGVVTVLAVVVFDLVGCGGTGGESSGMGGVGGSGGPDGSVTTGATTGSGAANGTGGSSATGGPSTSSASGNASTSTGSGASGGSGATANTGGAGGAPPAAVSSVEELCAAYPAAWGAYMARCHGGDAEEWQRTLDTPCGSAIQSESEGRIRLNTENAAICLDALAHQDCSGAAIPATACSDLFEGTVPAGEICNRLELWGHGDECESGAFCNAEVLGGCASVCSTYLQLGQGCTGQFNSTPCAPGTECHPDYGCIVPADDGEACREDWDCKSYNCSVPDTGTAGTCEPRMTKGGSCTTASQCAAGLKCVGATGEQKCVPPKPVGDTCTFGASECIGHCSLDGLCEIAAEEGEACGSVMAPGTERSESIACSGGLFCDPEDQTCRQLLQSGEQCTSSGVCASVGDRIAGCDEGECTMCD